MQKDEPLLRGKKTDSQAYSTSSLGAVSRKGGTTDLGLIPFSLTAEGTVPITPIFSFGKKKEDHKAGGKRQSITRKACIPRKVALCAKAKEGLRSRLKGNDGTHCIG